MLYPAYVEPGDENTAWSVTLPDFPGCFAAADSEAELPRAVQEAVEVYFDGEDIELPKPSSIADWKDHPDYDYDGVWMLFDIDTSRLNNRTRRINITMPESLLMRLDEAARAKHMSRSALLQELVRTAL